MNPFSKTVLDLYDGAQHCSASEFNEYGLQQIKRIIAFDSGAVVDLALGPDGGLMIQSLYLHRTPVERLKDRVATIGDEKLERDGGLHSQDATLAAAFKQPGLSITAEVAEISTDPRVLAYCRKYETAHSLAYVSRQQFGRAIPTLALWRASKRNPYSKASAHESALFIPHLLQARAINHRLYTEPQPPSGRGVVLATLQGQVQFIDEDAIRLLQLEWKEWSPPFLPRVLMNALAASGTTSFGGQEIVVRATAREEMLSLTVAKMHKAEPTAVSVKLTLRERDCLKWVSSGKTSWEIACILQISERTVIFHLANAARKLNTSTRPQTVAKALRLGLLTD